MIDGVEVRWLRTFKYRSARSMGRMLSWLHFEWQVLRMTVSSLPRPDVIVVSSLSLLTILNGLRLRRRFKCRLVFEVRDIWPLILTETSDISPNNLSIRVLGWIERLAYRKADLIVGTMPNLVEHVREVSGSQVPVVCVPQGLDSALLAPPAPLDPEYLEAHIPQDRFIVCHAGSIGADNALETLIECARAMRKRTDVHFLIVGEGYLKNRLVQATRDMDNLTFAPGVPKAAVQSVLARVDLLYFAVHKSSVLRFGQSLNKVIDYMLSGKPIVASYSGFPSMINEADCGSFVPAEDVCALRAEIERYVAMSPEQRHQIGERGRAWLLQNRRYETLAKDYMEFLGIDPEVR